MRFCHLLMLKIEYLLCIQASQVSTASAPDNCSQASSSSQLGSHAAHQGSISVDIF